MPAIIPDPNFDDPAAWSILTHAGTAAVTGGRLVCSAWRGSVTCAAPLPIIGRIYRYYLKVDSYSGAGLAAVQYGGTIPPIWSSSDGAGVFVGSFTATSDSFGVNIAIAFTPGDLIIDRFVLFEMHARQQIREAVAAAVTGLATTGSNVFQSRAWNLQAGELPALLVYTLSEGQSIPQTIGQPRRMLRSCEVVIEAVAIGAADTDDTLDDIAEEVEAAIGADPELGINCVDTVLDGVEIEYSTDGQQPIGTMRMSYTVTYITAENDPGTLL